jgi:hypothetical protein
MKANHEASILWIFQLDEIYVKSSFLNDFVKKCANITQDQRDEMCLYESIPFVNDCANICEKFFCE